MLYSQIFFRRILIATVFSLKAFSLQATHFDTGSGSGGGGGCGAVVAEPLELQSEENPELPEHLSYVPRPFQHWAVARVLSNFEGAFSFIDRDGLPVISEELREQISFLELEDKKAHMHKRELENGQTEINFGLDEVGTGFIPLKVFLGSGGSLSVVAQYHKAYELPSGSWLYDLKVEPGVLGEIRRSLAYRASSSEFPEISKLSELPLLIERDPSLARRVHRIYCEIKGAEDMIKTTLEKEGLRWSAYMANVMISSDAHSTTTRKTEVDSLLREFSKPATNLRTCPNTYFRQKASLGLEGLFVDSAKTLNKIDYRTTAEYLIGSYFKEASLLGYFSKSRIRVPKFELMSEEEKTASLEKETHEDDARYFEIHDITASSEAFNLVTVEDGSKKWVPILEVSSYPHSDSIQNAMVRTLKSQQARSHRGVRVQGIPHGFRPVPGVPGLYARIQDSPEASSQQEVVSTDEKVQKLVEMGFDAQRAVEVLGRFGGNFQEAMEFLLQ